jgi:hypothetical protein
MGLCSSSPANPSDSPGTQSVSIAPAPATVTPAASATPETPTVGDAATANTAVNKVDKHMDASSAGDGETAGGKVDKHMAPPTNLFRKLIDQGNVIPCEKQGPYYVSAYHAKVDGADFGFSSEDDWKVDQEAREAQLRECADWSDIDITKFDAEWCLNHGHPQVFQTKFDPGPNGAHRSMIEDQRKAMIRVYQDALDSVRQSEPARFAAMLESPAYAPFGSKMLQPAPAGTDSPYISLYKGALASLAPLWKLSEEVARAANESSVPDISWGLKKLRRVLYKVNSKYNDDPRKVTDMARTSIVFSTLAGLSKALEYILQFKDTPDSDFDGSRVVLMKNRFRAPASGYCDILVNVQVQPGGHICEVQFHMKKIYDSKKEGGHKAYKWFRLLTVGGVLESFKNEDNSVTNLPYQYKGNRDADGMPNDETGQMLQLGDGGKTQYRGSLKRSATGEMRSVKQGQGTEWQANGAVYSGSWDRDNYHGIGTFFAQSRNVYFGNFDRGEKRPAPTSTYWFADGKVAIVTDFCGTRPTGPTILREPGSEAWYFAPDGASFEPDEGKVAAFVAEHHLQLPGAEEVKPEPPEAPEWEE